MAHKADESLQEEERTIAICHKLMQLATVAIIGFFVAIVVMTTLSTGPFVQQVAKGLYFAILASAFGSLIVWGYRTYLQKRRPLENPTQSRKSQ